MSPPPPARDAYPHINRQGTPAALSRELVDKYSAFEEIDLAAYLAVRESAFEQVERRDPYAALLVSMHTVNLLTERADRSTIAPEQMPLRGAFLARQTLRQDALRASLACDPTLTPEDCAEQNILENFRLLQAVDNLSLLSCVAFAEPASLLHRFPARDGSMVEIAVHPVGMRQFQLVPYPFDRPAFTCTLPARHVDAKVFTSHAQLQEHYRTAPVRQLTVSISA